MRLDARIVPAAASDFWRRGYVRNITSNYNITSSSSSRSADSGSSKSCANINSRHLGIEFCDVRSSMFRLFVPV